MSYVAPTNPARRLQFPIAAGLLALALALALAEILSKAPLSWSLAIAGSLALLMALALILARFEAAVFIAFLLTSIVLVQPAPSDGLFGLIMAVAFVTGRFSLANVPRVALALVAVFLLINLASLSAVRSWSVAAQFFFITLYLAIFSLWLAGYVTGRARARLVVRAYLFTAVVSAVLATAALYVPFPGHLTLLGDSYDRAKGLFKDPNVYGPFLIPIALIVIEEVFNPRLLRMRRIFKLACFLVLVLGVFFSYSRAAWLNLAVGVIVLVMLVFLRRPDQRAIAMVGVIVGGVLAIIGAIYVTGSLTFLQERAKFQNYDNQRFGAQARGLSLGAQHLFGVGPGQFELLSPLATHSLYVRSFAEQGYPGLIVMALIILATCVYGFANVIRGRDTYGISSAALLAAWVGVAANSFFVDTMHWRHMWLVAGLIWAGVMRPTRPPERDFFAARLSPAAPAPTAPRSLNGAHPAALPRRS
jgi:hypothetical protein